MEKRLLGLHVAMLICCCGLIYRLSFLMLGEELAQVSTTQSTYTVKVGEERGMIYDQHLKPLVNSQQKIHLAIAPTPQVLTALQQSLPTTEFATYHPLLTQGKPLVIMPSKNVIGHGISTFYFPTRYGTNQLAPHIIGYTDQDNTGITGIEKGYNNLLASYGGSVYAKYDINANGRVLGEDVVSVVDSRPKEHGGVVLSLDREIQQIAELASSSLTRGAVVIMDVGSGDILSSVSCPSFDPTNIQQSLSDPNSPMVNRAISAYNVGSTFKLVIAAAALEAGYTTDYKYTCAGYYELGDIKYYCHNRTGHWDLMMERGVGQSCNPYFINLGLSLGADTVCTLASAFGYGHSIQLAENIIGSKGNLPPANTVTIGELANLSFGQGKLLATPVQVTQMTAIIANGGGFVTPTLHYGMTQDGHTVDLAPSSPSHQVISPSTATTLQELMAFVVSSGSGKQANPQYGSAGGKTATAQTGNYDENGDEIIHGWFSGFYPVEDPKYAITVFEEGGGDGGQLPAKIFGNICDELAILDNPFLGKIAK